MNIRGGADRRNPGKPAVPADRPFKEVFIVSVKCLGDKAAKSDTPESEPTGILVSKESDDVF